MNDAVSSSPCLVCLYACSCRIHSLRSRIGSMQPTRNYLDSVNSEDVLDDFFGRIRKLIPSETQDRVRFQSGFLVFLRISSSA